MTSLTLFPDEGDAICTVAEAGWSPKPLPVLSLPGSPCSFLLLQLGMAMWATAHPGREQNSCAHVQQPSLGLRGNVALCSRTEGGEGHQPGSLHDQEERAALSLWNPLSTGTWERNTPVAVYFNPQKAGGLPLTAAGPALSNTLWTELN